MEKKNIQDVSQEMIYVGSYHHYVDTSRRIRLPTKWRSANAEESTFMLMCLPYQGLESNCVQVLPPRVMNDLLTKMNGIPDSNRESAMIKRAISSTSQLVHMGKVGRICIPEMMAHIAGIENQAILVGMIDRFQIWNPERYESVKCSDKESVIAILHNLL
jgi:MraZ protein